MIYLIIGYLLLGLVTAVYVVFYYNTDDDITLEDVFVSIILWFFWPIAWLVCMFLHAEDIVLWKRKGK
jgi:hypothetical protein